MNIDVVETISCFREMLCTYRFSTPSHPNNKYKTILTRFRKIKYAKLIILKCL